MKNSVMMIDPPSGWRYGFPKQVPDNLREMDSSALGKWLVDNGYPQSEVDRYLTNPNWGAVPCSFFMNEIDT